MSLVRGGLLVAIGAVVLLASLPATSPAAYPGRNGLIAYSGSERSSRAELHEIFTIPPSGGDPTQLTHNGLLDHSPAWSADGRRIVFVRGVDSNVAIWAMRANGRHQHKIIRLGFRASSSLVDPSFTPSGGRIVFALRRSIATVGIHGNNLRRLVFGTRQGDVGSPEYSPDGKRIAFEGRPEGRDVRASIWSMDRDGSHLRRITHPGPKGGFDDSPDWRPDGRRILFRHCGYFERICDGGVYSVHPDGSDLRPFDWTSYPGVYSPTGHRVALYSLGWDSVFQNVKCADIFIGVAPGNPRQDFEFLTHNCDGGPDSLHGIGDAAQLAADTGWLGTT